MSATREILCEKIGVLEEALALALESCIDKTDKNIEYLRDEIFSRIILDGRDDDL